MKISKREQGAIKEVVAAGAAFGYGNMIGHLASAWAAHLVREGLDEATALDAVGGRDPYPIAMHLDLMERGEWDETGERYKAAKQ